MPHIDAFLNFMLEHKASDMHLSSGSPVAYRIDGEMVFTNSEPFDSDYIEALVFEIMSERNQNQFRECNDTDLAYSLPTGDRFRVNVFRDLHGVGVVARVIPANILTFEQLGLSPAIRDLCTLNKGLVLVTGPTGSGKSTTLAAMIDYINEKLQKHIITIEDPIEFVHQNKNCTIVHREVGIHSESFPRALRGAMRSDPDIVLIGEMRENETIRLGLTCAAMGMLVFATLHTNNAPKTVDRIIDAFPADEQAQIRTMLAECLQAIVSQLLCRKKNGGRVAVHEILLWADGLPNTIREGQIANIRTIIDSNGGRGMRSMDNSIQEQLAAGNITAEEAYMKASDKSRFLAALEAEEAAAKAAAQEDTAQE